MLCSNKVEHKIVETLKNMIETFRKSKIYLVGRHVWALAREAYYDEKEALKQKWAPKTAVLIRIRELNISYLLITQRGPFHGRVM